MCMRKHEKGNFAKECDMYRKAPIAWIAEMNPSDTLNHIAWNQAMGELDEVTKELEEFIEEG